MPVRPGRRLWILSFLGFFLVIGAWAVAMPYDASPDEQQHALRAASVARGHVFAKPEPNAVPGGGAYVHVPAGLLRDNCFKHRAEVSAACATAPGGDDRVVRTGSAAGRYHPGYYAIVGWPLALFPDWAGVLLARLVSAALCAALLANALCAALRWSRFGLVAAGVLVAATPMAGQMGGSINPNGVEIAAGIAFFAAAVPLLYAPGGPQSRTLLWQVGIAALALASLRSMGPVWLAVSAVALLLPLQWRPVRELWRRPAARWWTAVIGLAVVANVAWTYVFKTNFAGDMGVRQRTTGQAIRRVVDHWDNYTSEMVGVGGWLDTYFPPPVYLIWHLAAGALLIGGFLLADRGIRWRLAGIAAGGALLPSIIQVRGMNTYGLIMQGRYLLPVLVGLPLLAAFAIARYGVPADRGRGLIRMFVVLLLPLHLLCLSYAMVRWQQGLQEHGGLGMYDPFRGEWHPPLGSVVPIVASLVGLLLIAWRVWSPSDGGAALADAAGVTRTGGVAVDDGGTAGGSEGTAGPAGTGDQATPRPTAPDPAGGPEPAADQVPGDLVNR